MGVFVQYKKSVPGPSTVGSVAWYGVCFWWVEEVGVLWLLLCGWETRDGGGGGLGLTSDDT